MIKRLFDVFFSVLGLLILSPIFLAIAIIIILDSKGFIFYKQVRVGKDEKDFKIYKFRTMHNSADKLGLLTIGERDPRITKAGYSLRKYKLDEFPQLLNVLIGDMSFVGPRPEVRKYVNLYSEDDKLILKVKPGITDYASIYFRNESEIINKSSNPEKIYINKVMPEKIRLNKIYIKKQNIFIDIKIILKTILSIIS